MTAADLFFNEALLAARDDARPECPLSCLDENGDGKCTTDELKTTATVGGTWSFSTCAVKTFASTGPTPTTCSQTQLRVRQREDVVSWDSAPTAATAIDPPMERGTSGYVIDSPSGFVSMAFPRLADGTTCLGITTLTVNRTSGRACLMEVVTQAAGSGCTPRARWVYSLGTMSYAPSSL